MKITDKTLMINFENVVTLGNNDAIELKLIHQAFISRDKLGKLDIDVELMDIVEPIASLSNIQVLNVCFHEFCFCYYKLLNKI